MSCAQGEEVSQEGRRAREYDPRKTRRRSRKDVDRESEDDRMNLLRRHIGRRVAGIGVGVALLMLGLEAPAFAALGITSFTPTSGPAVATGAGDDGCVISITGTDFTNPDVSDVFFTQAGDTFATGPTLPAFDFAVQSVTEIWTTVPTGALTGPIAVENTQGTVVVSASSFTVTAGAAGDPCGPTVASFTPTCGVVGTAVTVTGTNLLQNSGDGTLASEGGNVRFAPYGVNATPTGAAASPTQISVNVPASASDGPIRVTTFATAGGTVDTTATFDVVTDPALCAVALPFARSITLRLRDALVARGKVSASLATAPAGCTAAVPVKIQRRRPGGAWRTVGSTTTSDTGAYRKKIRNRHGKYRSLAPKLTLASGDVCGRDVSNVVRH
jgi:hypothetical protein